MKRLDPEELFIGRKATFSKTITDADILLFSGITGDYNPAHVNESYAKIKLGGRIAHGMLTASLLSTIVGMGFPTGGIFIEQTIKYKAPVHVNETITAIGEIADITFTKSGRRIITLNMQVVNEEGTVVIESVGKTLSLN